MMEILSIFIVLIYSYQIYRFTIGWHNLRSYKTGVIQNVSIVIAFRNEEENIPFLLEDLSKQDYPLKCIELILVDDFSNDNSFELTCLKESSFEQLNNKKIPNKRNKIKYVDG